MTAIGLIFAVEEVGYVYGLRAGKRDEKKFVYSLTTLATGLKCVQTHIVYL